MQRREPMTSKSKVGGGGSRAPRADGNCQAAEWPARFQVVTPLPWMHRKMVIKLCSWLRAVQDSLRLLRLLTQDQAWSQMTSMSRASPPLSRNLRIPQARALTAL